MRLRDAREIARQWVEAEASGLPGVHGAYLAGSISALDDDATVPDASDIDVKVVIDAADVDPDPQKHRCRGALLDVSYGSWAEIASPEAVLANYYTAVHFTHPSILSDPTGELAALQAAVVRDYARREWVRARCDHARRTLEGALTRLRLDGPTDAQVMSWLFPVIFIPPMVLVADLRNPTHRRGLATLGSVLARYGSMPLHERVLEIAGSARMPRAQVESLLAGCAAAFDAAAAVRTTPVLLGSNISEMARPIVIGGAEELIAEGFHREAVPWITFMHTLCQTILRNDAPAEVVERLTPVYERLLDAVGIETSKALRERHEAIQRLVPDLRDATEAIIATNPAIRA